MTDDVHAASPSPLTEAEWDALLTLQRASWTREHVDTAEDGALRHRAYATDSARYLRQAFRAMLEAKAARRQEIAP